MPAIRPKWLRHIDAAGADEVVFLVYYGIG